MKGLSRHKWTIVFLIDGITDETVFFYFSDIHFVCDIFTEHRLKAFLRQLLCRNLISGSMNTVVDFSAPGKGLSV